MKSKWSKGMLYCGGPEPGPIPPFRRYRIANKMSPHKMVSITQSIYKNRSTTAVSIKTSAIIFTIFHIFCFIDV